MYYEIGIAVFMVCFLYAAVHVVHQPGAELLVMIFIFARLLPKFSVMQQTAQQFINALPCFKAVDQMRQRFEAAEEGCRLSSAKPVVLKKGVDLRRASFRYDDEQGVYALRGMNLFIPAGSITALVGPSGGGKSTLADLLLGLFVPEKGEILIDDEPLNGERIISWRNCVGYVPQETFLFHDTVRGNLLWAQPEANENELWQALHLAAADRFVAALPKGLDTVVGDRGMRLSGGERQRIALARAVLRKPTLLLLDEATSALDTKSETQIQKAVEKLHGQMTIVVIAHRLSTVQKADRIWVLDNGQVTEKGTWDELLVKPGGWFRTMWNVERGMDEE
jgi:ATP-binding cassette subfamily C protein